MRSEMGESEQKVLGRDELARVEKNHGSAWNTTYSHTAMIIRPTNIPNTLHHFTRVISTHSPGHCTSEKRTISSENTRQIQLLMFSLEAA